VHQRSDTQLPPSSILPGVYEARYRRPSIIPGGFFEGGRLDCRNWQCC